MIYAKVQVLLPTISFTLLENGNTKNNPYYYYKNSFELTYRLDSLKELWGPPEGHLTLEVHGQYFENS